MPQNAGPTRRSSGRSSTRRQELSDASKAVATRAAAPTASPPVPRHPKLESNPAWMALPAQQRYFVDYFLKAMDVEDPVKRQRDISMFKGQHEREFEMVARRHPEIRAMAAYDPLARSA